MTESAVAQNSAVTAPEHSKHAMSSREKLILISISIGTLMTALDATIVNIAIPTISEEFGATAGTSSWILLAYTLMLACFMLLWGKLGAISSYKKIFLIGVGIFTASSLVLGLAGFIESLGIMTIIIMRAVQGLGAGMIMSMNLAMVTSYISPAVRGSAMGIITLMASLGTALGPALGGVLTSVHWSLIFFINVPIGLACILMSIKSMSSIATNSSSQDKKSIDILGAILLFFALFSFIYLMDVGKGNWTSPTVIALAIATIVFLVLIYFQEKRAKDPIINARMLTEKNILFSCIANLLMFGAMAGCYFFLPYYLEGVLRQTTMSAGLILVANSIGVMVAGILVGKLMDKSGECRKYALAGCLVTAVGFITMLSYDLNTSIIQVIATLLLMGFGMGLTLVPIGNIIFTHTVTGEEGAASSFINTFRQMGSSVGLAIMQAVFIAVWTINAILTRPELVERVIEGFHVVFIVCALFAVIAFVLMLIVRDGPNSSHKTPETEEA
ncbi:MFS transporter [Candidatus Methanomassiliicoccus intestinalis]|uniref:MFS transporter n=1 Tax=Candidatus Methanomassiliicoccus intestinalis TaxID=1406512 RepID=UPI0037DD9653